MRACSLRVPVAVIVVIIVIFFLAVVFIVFLVWLLSPKEDIGSH